MNLGIKNPEIGETGSRDVRPPRGKAAVFGHGGTCPSRLESRCWQKFLRGNIRRLASTALWNCGTTTVSGGSHFLPQLHGKRTENSKLRSVSKSYRKSRFLFLSPFR